MGWARGSATSSKARGEWFSWGPAGGDLGKVERGGGQL